MGACACGEFCGIARFPGPKNTWYVLGIYQGCSECHTDAGLVLYRFEKDQQDMWEVEESRRLNVQHRGLPEWQPEAEGYIPVVDEGEVRRVLVEKSREHWEDYHSLDPFLQDHLKAALLDGAFVGMEKWAKALRADDGS